ncbi:MAG: 4Fe-4S dicluster domain-containing protein [bacterium]|nr:4Fe-4S dicluster domain-containing protein [bacterium]
MNILSEVWSGFTTTLKGMWVTGREYLTGKPITVQYPYTKREMPYRFRGMLVNDVSICNGCTKCSRVCPVNCIEIEAEGKGKERHVTKWVLNYQKCCWCELCVEVCPDTSLLMSHDYETVFTDRNKMIRDFVADPIPPFTDVNPKPGTNPYPKKENEGDSESGRAAA